MFQGHIIWRGLVYAVLMAIGKLLCGVWLIRLSLPPSHIETTKTKSAKKSGTLLPKPKSLYPASLLGCAMVARGEIGFLISAVAASKGIFDTTDEESSPKGVESELYLIVTWAILLCTIVGPLTLGFLTKRVRRLQAKRGNTATQDPLGIWGMK